MAGSDPAKLRLLALLWSLALLLSAALVAAGRHWPVPLTPRPLPIWCLLALPPLLTGLWLLGGWSLPPAGEGGQSESSKQEQQR